MSSAKTREQKLIRREVEVIFDMLTNKNLISVHTAKSIPCDEVQIAEIAFDDKNILVACRKQNQKLSDLDLKLLDRWLFLLDRDETLNVHQDELERKGI